MMIILDTNMLLVPGQYKIDIFDELIKLGYTEFIITNSVVRELLILSKKYKKKKDIMAVNLAMSLLDRCKIVEMDKVMEKQNILRHTDRNTIADDDILDLADEIGAVATNDKKLIEDLKKRNVKVVRLRQKKFLVEE